MCCFDGIMMITACRVLLFLTSASVACATSPPLNFLGLNVFLYHIGMISQLINRLPQLHALHEQSIWHYMLPGIVTTRITNGENCGVFVPNLSLSFAVRGNTMFEETIGCILKTNSRNIAAVQSKIDPHGEYWHKIVWQSDKQCLAQPNQRLAVVVQFLPVFDPNAAEVYSERRKLLDKLIDLNNEVRLDTKRVSEILITYKTPLMSPSHVQSMLQKIPPNSVPHLASYMPGVELPSDLPLFTRVFKAIVANNVYTHSINRIRTVEKEMKALTDRLSMQLLRLFPPAQFLNLPVKQIEDKYFEGKGMLERARAFEPFYGPDQKSIFILLTRPRFTDKALVMHLPFNSMGEGGDSNGEPDDYVLSLQDYGVQACQSFPKQDMSKIYIKLVGGEAEGQNLRGYCIRNLAFDYLQMTFQGFEEVKKWIAVLDPLKLCMLSAFKKLKGDKDLLIYDKLAAYLNIIHLDHVFELSQYTPLVSIESMIPPNTQILYNDAISEILYSHGWCYLTRPNCTTIQLHTALVGGPRETVIKSCRSWAYWTERVPQTG